MLSGVIFISGIVLGGLQLITGNMYRDEGSLGGTRYSTLGLALFSSWRNHLTFIAGGIPRLVVLVVWCNISVFSFFSFLCFKGSRGFDYHVHMTTSSSTTATM